MATLPQGGTAPNSQAQLNGVLAHDSAQNNVPVHTFNPDASPEEKGAAAGQGKDKLKSAKEQENGGAGEKGVLHILLSQLQVL